jgi:hypothetical protein
VRHFTEIVEIRELPSVSSAAVRRLRGILLPSLKLYNPLQAGSLYCCNSPLDALATMAHGLTPALIGDKNSSIFSLFSGSFATVF